MLTKLNKEQKEVIKNIVKRRKSINSFKNLSDMEIIEISRGEKFNRDFIFAINEYIDYFQAISRAKNPFF